MGEDRWGDREWDWRCGEGEGEVGGDNFEDEPGTDKAGSVGGTIRESAMAILVSRGAKSERILLVQ
jgi:hypothetical protein